MSKIEIATLTFLLTAMSVTLVFITKTTSKDDYGEYLLAYGCAIGWTIGRVFSIIFHTPKSS